MASVILLGDVHLGKSTVIGRVGIGSTLNSRIVDQLNLLDWVLEKAIEYHARRIIITGDVFEDPKPHPTLITLFLSWLNKCVSNDIAVDIIVGNHDILRIGNHYVSPLDIVTESNLFGCSVYKDITTIYVDDVAFTFLPFRDRKSFNSEINTEAISLLGGLIDYEAYGIPIPFTKILVGHVALEGSIPVGDEIDDLTNELFCPPEMFRQYDYVWMGHVHKPQVISDTDNYIAHIGSMDISNFGETDHKKHIVIIDTNTIYQKNNFIKLELPTRALSKIAITIPKDTEDSTKFVIDEITNRKINLSKSIVKLEVSLGSSDMKSVNRSEVEKFLYKEGAFNIAGFSESKKLNPIKRDSNAPTNIDTTMDVPSAIKMWALKKWPDDADETKRNRYISSAIDIYNEYKAVSK